MNNASVELEVDVEKLDVEVESAYQHGSYIIIMVNKFQNKISIK
jgi:hypothetical protein